MNIILKNILYMFILDLYVVEKLLKLLNLFDKFQNPPNKNSLIKYTSLIMWFQ